MYTFVDIIYIYINHIYIHCVYIVCLCVVFIDHCVENVLVAFSTSLPSFIRGQLGCLPVILVNDIGISYLHKIATTDNH